MDRGSPETGGVLATKPNGQKHNALPFSNRRLSRKSLGAAESKENNAASDTDGSVRATPRLARTSIRGHRPSDSLIENRFASPSPSIRVDRSTTPIESPGFSRSTRIPRPAPAVPASDSRRRDLLSKKHHPPNQPNDHSSPMRQPMSLRAAFKRAQEQTAADENAHSDDTLDLQQAFSMANHEFDAIRGIDGSPSPAPRPFRRSSIPSRKGAGMRASDLSSHLERFDRNHQLAGGGGPLGGLFTKNRNGSLASDMVPTSADKPRDGGLVDNSKRQLPDVLGISPKKQGEIEAIGVVTGKSQAAGVSSSKTGADVPVPSIEYGYASGDRPSPNIQPTNMSPDKSMNWHLDADFTAGDLQFSESPRITTKKPSFGPSHRTEMPAPNPNNDRISQIRQREIEAAAKSFPEDSLAVKRANHRLDEIRAREAEALSRRAVASSRLDEIRIKNSEPRSKSPEILKDRYKKPLEESSIRPDTEEQYAPALSSDTELKGEPIRDTPIVVFKNLGDKISSLGSRDRTLDDDKRGHLPRSDSHDLLRRLARATSSSPKVNLKEVEQGKDNPITEKTDVKQLSETRISSRPPVALEEGRVHNPRVKNPKDRPTVGFTDLMRIPSGDSIEGKRTSKPTSEVDPTDRIEAELNLFAPLDNYSEKGSIRAPSPVPSEPTETPRPPKIDPLTMPTPRVSGAYVDTPATVRVKSEDAYARDNEIEPIASGRGPVTRDRVAGLSPTKRTTDQRATGRVKSLRRPGPRSSSAPTSNRSRSSSRRRRPLVNTAKPPTVREDIISILRANNIDDSTLENLDSILADRGVDDQELKQMVNDTVLQVEGDLDAKFSEMSDRERELEAYDRMSKSLQTGLLGIRSAKKGIERLEDKVTHQIDKDGHPRPKSASGAAPIPQTSPPQNEAAPILISVPRLYRRTPDFKLTKLGIITICAVLWYALECAFCSMYAGPDYVCTPSVPCDWSPNEPYFPYTMPFMLDEWATGGKGRALALKVGQEIGDVAADISDWATNTDFTQFDERYMDIWQRKRHRRRLRKHGYIQKWTEPLGYEARFPEWEAAKAAREMAQEYGFDEEYDTMDVDEIV